MTISDIRYQGSGGGAAVSAGGFWVGVVDEVEVPRSGKASGLQDERREKTTQGVERAL
jgi:hypothetical protein